MKGMVVFYIKTTQGVSDETLKKQFAMIERLNEVVFNRLRMKGFEFMYVPSHEDASHVFVAYFNAPPGLEEGGE
jgi:hypothetical protein